MTATPLQLCGAVEYIPMAKTRAVNKYCTTHKLHVQQKKCQRAIYYQTDLKCSLLCCLFGTRASITELSSYHIYGLWILYDVVCSRPGPSLSAQYRIGMQGSQSPVFCVEVWTIHQGRIVILFGSFIASSLCFNR